MCFGEQLVKKHQQKESTRTRQNHLSRWGFGLSLPGEAGCANCTLHFLGALWGTAVLGWWQRWANSRMYFIKCSEPEGLLSE